MLYKSKEEILHKYNSINFEENSKNTSDLKHSNLYISKDITLWHNSTYVFNDVYIKNCEIKMNRPGIVKITSLNNIISDNSKINMNGGMLGNELFLHGLKIKNQSTSYNYNLNEVYIGSKGSNGDSCSGGGSPGNGIIFECKEYFVLINKSCISGKGSGILHKRRCWYGCSDGDDGSLLIQSKYFVMDNTSLINYCKPNNSYYQRPARIVLNVQSFHKIKLYLISGYVRQWLWYGNDIICDIIYKYYDFNGERNKALELKLLNGNIINPLPYFVDKNFIPMLNYDKISSDELYCKIFLE